MTQKFFFSVLFLVAGLIVSKSSYAGQNKTTAATINVVGDATTHTPIDAREHSPALPAPSSTRQQHGPHQEGKLPAPKMEELPHIHHFHKERVRKVKRHHRKLWMIVKLIVILCHIGLLICGYLHATH